MTLNSKRALTVAIDTSTDMLVCALRWTDLETGEEHMLSRDHMCRRHANVELVNTVQAALAEAGFGIADVDAIVVGRGPGSFTGVRIGISTAKGLACGANVPLLGASTLDACAWTAWRAGERGLVGVLADAMRGEVYPALYRIDETGPQRLFDRERVVKAAVALDEWRERADWAEIRLTGDGLVRYGKLLSEDEAARCLERSLWWPSGEGLLRSEATGDGDPAGVLPIYTRLSDAEENERRRLGLGESAHTETTGVADELAGRHLQYRPMGAADAEGAAALDASCFADASHEAWSAKLFLDELAQDLPAPRSWWVAHDNGHIIGVAGGMVVDGDVQILDVAVDSAHRREGIARYAGSPLKYSVDEAHQKKSMTLVTLGDTVETTCIPVTPLHDVKRIEGTFAALLENGQAAPNEDYVEILLTDDEPVFRPADRLRPYYPNVLGVRSTWFLKQHAGTQAEADLHSRSRAELFRGFLKEVCGEEAQPEDEALLAEILKELEGDAT